MRNHVMVALLLAAVLFASGMPAAQNAPTNGHRDASSQTPARATASNFSASDECQPMMDMIEHLQTNQQQMSVTINSLVQNVTDLEKAKDSAVLKTDLAQQGGMLNVLKVYLTQEGHITQLLADRAQRMCPAPPSPPQPASK
jgi:hypothetical protein